jgi:hypothetical protein
MNEEEVKGRIVFPWLQSQGLAPDELFFETSFSVRIGTNTLRVGGRPARCSRSRGSIARAAAAPLARGDHHFGLTTSETGML